MADGASSRRVRWSPAARTLGPLLFLLALVLRAWPGMGYAHDELSALIRLFPALADTIAKGVVGVDTHPPGVQVFLWAWTRMAGLEEWAVKLPFVLASVGALVYLHRVAVRLAGTSVALLTTALLAGMQFNVLYGQLARPYAFGLLTTACMMDALLRYRDAGRRGALVTLAACAALSGWIHHIALLQALLIGLAGLVLVPAPQRRDLLLAGAAAVLLYLPNVPLLLRQFAWKGLDEWLAPPTWRWFLEHAGFLAHWSVAFGVLLAAVVAWALVRGLRDRRFTLDVVLVGLLCGAVPYLVVFAYSTWRAPVLQHSVMLFAFPYALLLLLAGFRDLPSGRAATLATALAATAVVTLVTTRRHYTLNAHANNRYEAISRGIIAANEDGIPALVDAPAHVLRHTFERWYVTDPHSYIDLTKLDAAALDRVLDSLRSERVFLGVTLQAPVERAWQVRRHFPFLLARHDMAEGQTFLFGARPAPAAIDDALFGSTITPQAIQGRGWTIDPLIPLVADTSGRGRCWDLTGRDFGIAFEAMLDTLTAGPNDEVELRIDLAAPAEHVMGVLEVKHDDATLVYRTSPATGTIRIAAACLADVKAPLESLRLKAYVWNSGRRKALVTAATITVRRGNPVRYAWLGPMKGAWTYR